MMLLVREITAAATNWILIGEVRWEALDNVFAHNMNIYITVISINTYCVNYIRAPF